MFNSGIGSRDNPYILVPLMGCLHGWPVRQSDGLFDIRRHLCHVVRRTVRQTVSSTHQRTVQRTDRRKYL
jgi:hypothetical protein